MKFDIKNNELLDSDGRFLKKLRCDYRPSNEELKTLQPGVHRCTICNDKVYETKNMSENEVKELLQKDREACLKIDINQDNIQVIFNEI